jgi:hypothetical protein
LLRPAYAIKPASRRERGASAFYTVVKKTRRLPLIKKRDVKAETTCLTLVRALFRVIEWSCILGTIPAEHFPIKGPCSHG